MRIKIPLLFLVILTSCATTYRQSSFWHNDGYSEVQVTPNTFIVTFHGHRFTSMETAVQFAMLRASELTLKNDCRYFVILSTIDQTRVSQGNSTPGTTLSIQCFADKPQTGNVIDAQLYWDFNTAVLQ